MEPSERLDSRLTPSQPTPFAATIWKDQPDLFEQLRRRLASFAPNTQRALASDWKVWRLWCLENARIEFPASPKDISEFALAHSPPLYTDQTGAVTMDPDATGPLVRRATTVQRWLASLATLHRVANAPDPTKSEDVKAARRLISRGRGNASQRAPLHWTDVQAALAALDNSPRNLRAKAMISVAYSTMARRAELVGIRVEDISHGLDGDGTVTLRTKGGAIQERYLAREARVALDAWRQTMRIKKGPVFLGIKRDGSVAATPITSAEVARTFKRIAKCIGLNAEAARNISGHSTRIGAAQDLTTAGAALPEIMTAGGWRSPGMPARYARKLDVRRGAMRELLTRR
ncbi:MAG: tyrosine-type recombinase/integrase [Betaproteobacteria bacterium]